MHILLAKTNPFLAPIAPKHDLSISNIDVNFGPALNQHNVGLNTITNMNGVDSFPLGMKEIADANSNDNIQKEKIMKNVTTQVTIHC